MKPVNPNRYVALMVFSVLVSVTLIAGGLSIAASDDSQSLKEIMFVAVLILSGLLGLASCVFIEEKREYAATLFRRYQYQYQRHKTMISGVIYDTDFSERLWTSEDNRFSFWRTNMTGQYFVMDAERGISPLSKEAIEIWLEKNLDADKASATIALLFGKKAKYA